MRGPAASAAFYGLCCASLNLRQGLEEVGEGEDESRGRDGWQAGREVPMMRMGAKELRGGGCLEPVEENPGHGSAHQAPVPERVGQCSEGCEGEGDG